MLRHSVFLASLLAAASATAACPQFLDQEFRRLHSSDSVNLCEVLQGRPVLIVNTASHCGFTSQFAGLQALYEKYRERGLEVVGFPSNDFRQEAKDEEKAAEVCYVNYGVTFTMVAPSHVRGADANPVFLELAAKTTAPSWNFNKYLLDREGNVIEHFGSNTKPSSAKLEAAIESVL